MTFRGIILLSEVVALANRNGSQLVFADATMDNLLAGLRRVEVPAGSVTNQGNGRRPIVGADNQRLIAGRGNREGVLHVVHLHEILERLFVRNRIARVDQILCAWAQHGKQLSLVAGSCGGDESQDCFRGFCEGLLSFGCLRHEAGGQAKDEQREGQQSDCAR